MAAPEPSEEQSHPQGLTERQAAFDVLGCDLDQPAFAALRPWGLGDEARQLAQRPGLDGAIRALDGDLDARRGACGLANRGVGAAGEQGPRRRQQPGAVMRRHARALSLTGRDIQLPLYPGRAQANLAQPRMLP